MRRLPSKPRSQSRLVSGRTPRWRGRSRSATTGAAADAALATVIDKHADTSAYEIAQVEAIRNDADNTFEWLERAWTNRYPGIGYLLYDPFILRYENDPRFAAFCRKVGLPVPGEREGG
jgi:serine/threonine-protein kinase